MKKLIFLCSLIGLISACRPEAQPIGYGEDQCDYCRMTIVDKQHAAELVTSKAKTYKFDAIECMIRYREDHPETEFALLLVNDYLAPESLIDATKSYYLISKAIPSPMGAYLSAFKTQAAVMDMKQTKGGEVYDWEEVVKKMKSQR